MQTWTYARLPCSQGVYERCRAAEALEFAREIRCMYYCRVCDTVLLLTVGGRITVSEPRSTRCSRSYRRTFLSSFDVLQTFISLSRLWSRYDQSNKCTRCTDVLSLFPACLLWVLSRLFSRLSLCLPWLPLRRAWKIMYAILLSEYADFSCSGVMSLTKS